MAIRARSRRASTTACRPRARAALARRARSTRRRCATIALAHEVCPYYLGQELARWADVIVGDYNYYFDRRAMLHALDAWPTSGGWACWSTRRTTCVERARGMYSRRARRMPRSTALRRGAPAAAEEGRWTRVDRALERAATRPGSRTTPCMPRCRTRFVAALQQAITAIDRLPRRAPDRRRRRRCCDFYFDALHFVRMAERSARIRCSTSRSTPADAGQRAALALCLRNVVPAPLPAAALRARAHGHAVFRDAEPAHFYRDTLGLPARHARWLDVASPFTARAAAVRMVARHLDALSRPRRSRSAPIVDLIARAVSHARPATTWRSSAASTTCDQVAGAFAARHPGIPIWAAVARA